jgi:hypothetical protein
MIHIAFAMTVLAMTYMRIQLRGAGDVARSLNVRGEEIYTALETVATLATVGYTYLVGGITDADVEIWELRLHHVSKNDIQTLLVWGRLESLGDFSSHTRIQFNGNTLLRLFENLGCQVTSSGTDFKHDLEIT